MPEIPNNMEEWLGCLSLPEYQEMIPLGFIKPIVGPVIWKNGNGESMSADQYKARYGFDPAEAWAAVQEFRRKNGKNDKTFNI